MPKQNQLLAILLLDGHAASFSHQASSTWQHERLHGEDWCSLTDECDLASALRELNARINHSNKLADFTLHLVYDQATQPWLAEVGKNLATVGCTNWQILQWLPLRDRASALTGKTPDATRPSIDWLRQGMLPILEATFAYQKDALAAEYARAEQAHVETLESLRSDRLQLETEIATQRAQLAALQRPEMDDLLAYLPALYRNVFGSLAPHDLALLAGRTEAPHIPSPWPEPAPDTLKALQSRLRKLPEQRAAQLRDFCQQLPHKLELRAEMRAWLGED